LDAYRDLDVEAVLATTGSEVIGHLSGLTYPGMADDAIAARLSDLERTEVELVSRNGGEAVVRVTVPGGEPADVAMTRVEGRWLPEDVAQRWPGAMARARTRLEVLGSGEGAQTEMQIAIALGLAERIIDQLDRIETPDDVDALIANPLAGLFARSGDRQRD
jgi:hypothetical protein